MKKLFFNVWYWGNPPWDTGISPPELISLLETREPGRALDLGCGTGTNVITMSKYGWEVAGIDFASSAIRTARKKSKQAGIHADFHVRDVTRLDFLTETYELIIDIGCLHGIDPNRRTSYYRNLDRLLARHGHYLLYAFVDETQYASRNTITKSDFDVLTKLFNLESRRDGTERGIRASSWFHFYRT